jgi:hypothetical protein
MEKKELKKVILKKERYCFLFCLLLFGCSQVKQIEAEKEYFVKQCSFVCDYPFDEISKYAVT